MRYSFAFTGLVTVAFSSGAFAQTTEPVETIIDPVPTTEPVVPPPTSVAPAPVPTDNAGCQAVCNADYDKCIAAGGTEECHTVLQGCFAACPSTDPPTDPCVDDCTKKHDACNTAPGANHASCASDYAQCLGYNPYGDNGFVAPTACSKSMTTVPGPKKTEAPEVCCVTCTTTYKACCDAAGDVIDHCKVEYTTCLGYNPFDIIPWVEPTVCKHDEPKPPKPTGTPEECCVQCTTVYDDCCAVDGAIIETCKTEYTVCLGYNPWDVVPWEKPSTCKHDNSKTPPTKGGKDGGIIVGPPTKQPSGTPEECCVTCTTTYKACCDAAGDVIDHCKVEYTTCLGYNPWEVVPWAEPTVCKHGDSTGTNGGDSTGTKGGDKGKDGKIITGPPTKQPSGTPEECCIECTTVYKQCCDESGDVIDHCKVAYTSCLGYNPFEVVPWVEPTVCKNGDDVVIVSGGESLRPALALLALGAVALFSNMKFLATLSFVTAAFAASRTSAPSGCLTVRKSPSSGQYGTIQAAVNALSTSSGGTQCIFIDQGTYNEQVLVPKRQAQLSIYGYTTDTSSYSGNKVTITAKKSQADGLNNDESATLRVKSPNFKLYNVNVANTYGKGSQAVALSAYADSGYYGCALTGYQDTLLSNEGYQLYSHTLIQGATDFIFGQRASSWFEKCDIRVVSASTGYITANGRDSSSGASYYVFNNCNIAAASGNSVSNGAYYLGRPWREYARVVFQKTSMTSVINAAGWKIWNSGDERTSNVLFGEYGNTGAGASGKRASFYTKLSSPVSISTILTGSYASKGFYDASYM
ncbi:hypothetical protein ACHAPT_008832 [Fusarium lateritium]